MSPWKAAAAAVGAAGAGMLLYGALVESNRLVITRRTLRLRGWPGHLDGFKLAVLGDFHLRDRYTRELGRRAIAATLEERPDFLALVGDYVGYWKPESVPALGELLEPLRLMDGNVVAVPGNHDYWLGDASLLNPIFEWLDIKLLRNEAWHRGGIEWIGIDSHVAGRGEPKKAIGEPSGNPRIVLWHEPDAVELLPPGADLMLAGHSHGGQFRFPGGWAPMHTKGGRKYVRGFYPQAPTPLFVTSGLGTTGPPSRFLCPPEVAILTLSGA